MRIFVNKSWVVRVFVALLYFTIPGIFEVLVRFVMGNACSDFFSMGTVGSNFHVNCFLLNIVKILHCAYIGTG